MKWPELNVGLSGSVQKKITHRDTALNYGSGALTTLLATPSMAALMIEAAVSTVDPLLKDPYITVAKALNISHEKPTLEGMTVTIIAKITEIDRNRLAFQISAYDEIGEIGHGYHERIIVNRYTILEHANIRCESIKGKIK